VVVDDEQSSRDRVALAYEAIRPTTPRTTRRSWSERLRACFHRSDGTDWRFDVSHSLHTVTSDLHSRRTVHSLPPSSMCKTLRKGRGLQQENSRNRKKGVNTSETFSNILIRSKLKISYCMGKFYKYSMKTRAVIHLITRKEKFTSTKPSD
jgi:hypothetical protein